MELYFFSQHDHNYNYLEITFSVTFSISLFLKAIFKSQYDVFVQTGNEATRYSMQ